MDTNLGVYPNTGKEVIDTRIGLGERNVLGGLKFHLFKHRQLLGRQIKTRTKIRPVDAVLVRVL